MLTDNQEMVDLAGFCQMVQISKRHGARMDASGQIPQGIKLGRCKRWAVQEIRDWVAAGCPNRSKWEVMKKAGPKLRVAR